MTDFFSKFCLRPGYVTLMLVGAVTIYTDSTAFMMSSTLGRALFVVIIIVLLTRLAVRGCE